MTDATSKINTPDLLSSVRKHADSIESSSPLMSDALKELCARYSLLTELAEFLAEEHILSLISNASKQMEQVTPAEKINNDSCQNADNQTPDRETRQERTISIQVLAFKNKTH